MPALHIITLVKWVPDSQLERHFTQQRRLDRSEGILGELDEYPLEAALQIREALQKSAPETTVRVSALTMGAPGATAALKKALQIGADDAHLLTDEALEAADLFSTSAALTAAINHVADTSDLPDAQVLVLTGMASEDGESGALAPQVAERLGAPALTQVSAVEVTGDRVTATRTAGPSQQRVATALPAVLSITDQANDPRYPNFKAIRAAKKKPITTFSLADLGLTGTAVESKVSVISTDARPERTAGEIVTDDGESGVSLVNFLEKERLL